MLVEGALVAIMTLLGLGPMGCKDLPTRCPFVVKLDGQGLKFGSWLCDLVGQVI